eukprot:COSAG02_NODE_32693_length_512_cov_0.806295_1_plen_105_part_01
MQRVRLLGFSLVLLFTRTSTAAEPFDHEAEGARPSPAAAPVLAEGRLHVGGTTTPKPPPGNVSAVEDLLDRVLPGAREHFQLVIDATVCSSNAGCFTLEDGSDGI